MREVKFKMTTEALIVMRRALSYAMSNASDVADVFDDVIPELDDTAVEEILQSILDTFPSLLPEKGS